MERHVKAWGVAHDAVLKDHPSRGHLVIRHHVVDELVPLEQKHCEALDCEEEDPSSPGMARVEESGLDLGFLVGLGYFDSDEGPRAAAFDRMIVSWLSVLDLLVPSCDQICLFLVGDHGGEIFLGQVKVDEKETGELVSGYGFDEEVHLHGLHGGKEMIVLTSC